MHDRMPSACFFAVISEGRTGSLYTVSALNSHPRVLCYPEIFYNRDRVTQRRLIDDVVRGRPATILSGAMRKYFFQDDPSDKHDLQAVGLKTPLHHLLDVVHFCTILRRHWFKLIYLKRKNIIKSVISCLNARRLRRRYRFSNASSPDQVQGAIHIRPELFMKELERRIQNEIRHEEFFTAYDLEKRTFYYEDLQRDWDAFWADLLAYLGVDWMPGKGRFFKNTPDRLSDAIRNYEEIRGMCAGTSVEPFFDE